MHIRLPTNVGFSLTLFASTFASTSALACATCGCSLSTDAAMGYSTDSGWRASLQYDFINQNQLRSGTSSMGASQVAALNNAGGAQEVEHDTLNRYLTFGLSYASSADWNYKLLVPYIDRSHSTYGDASNPLTPAQLSSASLTGLGDVRFVASYQGLLEAKNLGFQIGLKLPTGNYGGANAAGAGIVGRRPVAFSSGPAAAEPSPANLVDTSLQTGTGSTDIILGSYIHQAVSENFSAFANLNFQAAVAHKLDQSGQDYRPGNTTTLSTGLRYEARPGFVPQLQLNLYRKSADQGALADTGDTAGTVAYLSPGATVAITDKMQAYGFVQLPVSSHLAGYQLAPRWTASAGLSASF